MNKFAKNSFNISATLAIILSILSFIVPFLLGGFIIIGLGIFLGVSALFGEKKALGVVSIILCIVSLIISPTFWLYLGSLSISSKSPVSRMEKTQIQIPIETTTQDTGTPTKEQKEPTKEELEARLNGLLTSSAKDTRKKFYFAIIKQSDGSYNYYPLTFPMKGQAAVTKAFSMKGINASQVKVNIMDTNSRVVLETNAIEQSKNPNKLKEFLALYKDQKLEIRVDDNLVINVEYPVTAEIMEKYKDVIAEMNGYSGFSSQLITQ